MVEALRKLLLAGLGTLDLTEEKARAVFNDLVARGEMSEKDAREVFATWSKRAGEQRSRLQQDIDTAVTRALSVMGLVRRSEVEALRTRVAELEQRLGVTPAKVEEPAAAEPAPTPDVDRSGN
jgi:polyhydroxyalkanoate synthesis regulator phasin